MRTVFLDLETTGLDPRIDEIVEIGILDEDGHVLLDALVRPVRHQCSPGAQRVQGIAPADVQDAPTLDELRPRIIEAVSDALVVIYNAPFDAGFLRFELACRRGLCRLRLGRCQPSGDQRLPGHAGSLAVSARPGGAVQG